MKAFRFLDGAVGLLTRITLLCGGVLLLAMAVNVTYGVITRYAFHSPSIYAIELTKILMIPALVLAVPYVQRNDRHLKVDFLAMRFPAKAQLILFEIIVPICALFVGYVLVWKGWDSTAYSYSIHETSYSSWAEPLWPVRLMIPIGYGILCLALVAQICKGFAALFLGKAGTAKRSDLPPESEQA